MTEINTIFILKSTILSTLSSCMYDTIKDMKIFKKSSNHNDYGIMKFISVSVESWHCTPIMTKRLYDGQYERFLEILVRK